MNCPIGHELAYAMNWTFGSWIAYGIDMIGQFNSWNLRFQIMKPQGFNSWRLAVNSFFPTISEHLGHCNTEITSKSCVHIFKEYKAKMAEAIKHDLHIIKRSESASLLVSERVQIALRAFCKKQNRVRSTTSKEVKLASSICFNQKGRFDYMLSRLFGCQFGTTLNMIKRYLQTAPFVI